MGFQPTRFYHTSTSTGFAASFLFRIVDQAVASARQKLQDINNNASTISIADMFEMQMLMNHLSQLSEMTTNVVAAAHSSVMSMARNIKG